MRPKSRRKSLKVYCRANLQSEQADQQAICITLNAEDNIELTASAAAAKAFRAAQLILEQVAFSASSPRALKNSFRFLPSAADLLSTSTNRVQNSSGEDLYVQLIDDGQYSADRSSMGEPSTL